MQIRMMNLMEMTLFEQVFKNWLFKAKQILNSHKQGKQRFIFRKNLKAIRGMSRMRRNTQGNFIHLRRGRP